MSYTNFNLVVGDPECNATAEFKSNEGWFEMRIKASDEAKWTPWFSLSPEYAVEIAAAMMISAHFCQDSNASLAKTPTVEAMVEALAAKVVPSVNAG